VETQLDLTNMSPTFLDVLPFEIRTKIYRYILESFSGAIYLVPLLKDNALRYIVATTDKSCDQSEKIHLSFLRTCQQIHKEAKSFFWKYNCLHIMEAFGWGIHLSHSLFTLPLAIKSQVQMVRMDLNFLRNVRTSDSEGAEKQMGEVGAWPSLRSIMLVLHVWMDLEVGLIEPKKEAYVRKRLHRGYRMDLPKLRAVQRKYLSHLERKIICNSGMPVFSEVDGSPARRFALEHGDIREIYTCLHGAFGGSLWIDNRVCFTEGQMIDSIFDESEADGKKYLSFSRENHAYQLAKAIAADEQLEGAKGVKAVLLEVLAANANFYSWPVSFVRRPGTSRAEVTQLLSDQLRDAHVTAFRSVRNVIRLHGSV